MSKRGIYIGLFVVCIIGLTVVQYQYLKLGVNLAKVQFNSRVGQACAEIKEGLSSENQLTFLVGRALEEDTDFFTMGIDSVQDASSHFLYDYIAEKLVKHGIETDFSYQLQTRDTAYYLASPKRFDQEDKISTYPVELLGYLPEILKNRVILELQFKNLNNFYLAKLNGLTLPSLLFLVGICLTVLWALRTFYWQRNIITTTNEFINNLTHELKTPVFSIGLATKIMDEQATAEQKPLLAIIRQQIKRLSAHIDKVLELGNLESGKKVLQLERVDFKPVLQKICQEFNTLAGMEGVQFQHVLEEGAYDIKAETFHLENAIINVLDNAKKYAVKPIIVLEAGIKEGKLHISIKDNGKGIKKEDMERIFQKYYRVDQGNVHNVKGYGLGLSYVKEVLRRHKGKVHLKSELGLGTEVTLVIPLHHA
jgi:two-component system, OmpR family, phosphate regulon sensor histidine kinase PhoR